MKHFRVHYTGFVDVAAENAADAASAVSQVIRHDVTRVEEREEWPDLEDPQPQQFPEEPE